MEHSFKLLRGDSSTVSTSMALPDEGPAQQHSVALGTTLHTQHHTAPLSSTVVDRAGDDETPFGGRKIYSSVRESCKSIDCL